MAVAFKAVGTALASGARTTSTIPMPAGLAAGDEVRIAINAGQSGGTAPTITAPGTATLVATVTWGDGSYTVRSSIYRYRYVGSGDPASFAFTHSNVTTDGRTVAYSGVDAATPDDATAVTTSIANTGPAGYQAILNGITTVNTDTLLLVARWSWDGNAITPPAGYTERVDQVITWIGDSPKAATGATGTISVPAGSSVGVAPAAGIVMALRAATGGGSFTASGTVSSTSSVVGAVTSRLPSSGTVVSSSAVVGAVTASRAAAGTVTSTSAVTGAVTSRLPASGAVVSTSTVTGDLTTATDLSGTVASTSTVTGAVTSRLPSSGIVSSTSTVTGTVTSRLPTSGTVASTSTVQGTVTSRLPAAGVVQSTSTVSGTMDVPGGLAGVVTSTSSVTGTVTSRLPAAGVVQSTSTTAGAVTARLTASGTVITTSTVTGTMDVPGGLAGTVVSTSTVTGAVTARLPVTGTVVTVSTVTGTLTAGTGRNVVVTGSLGDRRWVATLTPTPRAGAIRRRWEGSL